jgi:hypothetical protein
MRTELLWGGQPCSEKRKALVAVYTQVLFVSAFMNGAAWQLQPSVQSSQRGLDLSHSLHRNYRNYTEDAVKSPRTHSSGPLTDFRVHQEPKALLSSGAGPGDGRLDPKNWLCLNASGPL